MMNDVVVWLANMSHSTLLALGAQKVSDAKALHGLSCALLRT